MHVLSDYYYYDYVVIGIMGPSQLTEIVFSIGLLLSKEVKRLTIIIKPFPGGIDQTRRPQSHVAKCDSGTRCQMYTAVHRDDAKLT